MSSKDGTAPERRGGTPGLRGGTHVLSAAGEPT